MLRGPYILATVAVFTSFLLIGMYWGYLGRSRIVESERQACHHGVTDRRAAVLVNATQAWATQQVADDPRQPTHTRRARAIEAAQDRSAVRDYLTRVDSPSVAMILTALRPEIRALVVSLDTGRRLNCAAEHPDATLLP
jgi:hypothetical protein